MGDERRVSPPGFAVSRPRRVLLVYPDDGYANTARARALHDYLQRHGHDVVMEDTYYLSRASSRRGSLGSKLPAAHPLRLGLYAVDAASVLVRRSAATRRHLSYYVRLADCKLRSRILATRFAAEPFDLVICTTPHDAWLLLRLRNGRTLYDCPTPWAQELYDDGKLTSRQYGRLKEREKELFEGVDYLAFNWESYAEYVLTRYGLSGRNLLTLNTGCTPKADRARFASPLRIAYVGSLAGKAIDLPMLSRLSKLYAELDVYGGPAPDPALGLSYRGYASSMDILREYQAGLITSSQDELRVHGFSAKHPEYLSYGLPVLVPGWRKGLDRLRGSIRYDESTFVSVVRGLEDPLAWQRASDEAYAQAEMLSWDETLRPLGMLLGNARADPIGANSHGR